VNASTRRNRLGLVLVTLWVTLATVVLLAGLGYYRLSDAERAYSAERALFAPTGTVGHSLGYIGTLAVIIGVAMYMLRKRWPPLARAGQLGDWLQVHIFLCTLGPYLVLVHTSFKFRGVAAISFWAMVAAVSSGIVGRYIYAHIPRTLSGTFRSLAALEEEVAGVAAAIDELDPAQRRAVAGLFGAAPAPPRSTVRALGYAVREDWQRRRRARGVRRALRRARFNPGERVRFGALLQRRMRLEQQIALLAPFQRLFHYWHVLHLPVALLMFLALAVHVTLAVLFGYAWPF
jgi:hypothetical protein